MNIINKILKKDKWKIYLYYQNRQIKKMYVDDNFKPLEEYYILRIIGKKYLFGSNNVKMMFVFDKLKESKGKDIHIELKIWEGVRQ